MESRDRTVRGLVLAGRFPWSESPLDQLLPRQMLPVAHEPLISYPLRWLRRGGIHEVTVCLNPASRNVRAALTEYGADLPSLAFHMDALPRGPAGAARDAALQGDGETFVVVDGTAMPTDALADVLQTHRASGALATIVVVQPPQTSPQDGEALSSPAGVYVFERRALEVVPGTGFQDIKETLIPQLHRTGERVGVHVGSSTSPRVVNVSTYIEANRWALANLSQREKPADGFHRLGDVVLHESAHIDPGARVIGSALVGPHSKIMRGATLIGPAVLGTGCTLAARAVVSRTIAWNRCLVRANAVVDNSVMADDAIADEGSYRCGEILVPARRGALLPQIKGERMRSIAIAAFRPRPAER